MGPPFARPWWPKWGSMVAILDFAGIWVFQVVWHCRRWASGPGTAPFLIMPCNHNPCCICLGQVSLLINKLFFIRTSKIQLRLWLYQISCIRYWVSDINYQYQVSDTEYQISSIWFKYQISMIRYQVFSYPNKILIFWNFFVTHSLRRETQKNYENLDICSNHR